MKKSKASVLVLILLLMAGFAAAQSANEYDAPEVIAIAKQLRCDCGCNLDMACVMPPSGVCGICRDNKIRIAAMLKEGLSQQQILDFYVQENGEDILVVRPGTAGFVTPYIALGLGAGVVFFVIRRYLHLKPAPAVAPGGDEELARFQAEIDRDLQKLD